MLSVALFGLACGRTDLALWTAGVGGADAVAGATASSAGADFGGSGGAPGSGPDFDFTPMLDQATAYQVHPSHSGSQQSVTITPPLARVWVQHFDGIVSYPIMADARVFVALNTTDPRTDPVVQALDAASGTVLWSSQPLRARAPSSPLALAYDRDLLFAANESGDVLALEPATGNVRWRITLGAALSSGALPIAAGGAVMFVGAVGSDQSALAVIDERDGSLVHTVALPVSGDPTLGGGRIYVTGNCDDTVAVNAATGNVEWSTTASCSPVAGRRGSVIHDGVLWLPPSDDGIRAVDPASGMALGAVDDDGPEYMLSAAEDQLVLPSLVLRTLCASSARRRELFAGK